MPRCTELPAVVVMTRVRSALRWRDSPNGSRAGDEVGIGVFIALPARPYAWGRQFGAVRCAHKLVVIAQGPHLHLDLSMYRRAAALCRQQPQSSRSLSADGRDRSRGAHRLQRRPGGGVGDRLLAGPALLVRATTCPAQVTETVPRLAWTSTLRPITAGSTE
jgi:hypothetical protein